MHETSENVTKDDGVLASGLPVSSFLRLVLASDFGCLSAAPRGAFQSIQPGTMAAPLI
jgi:hypothetical protein